MDEDKERQILGLESSLRSLETRLERGLEMFNEFPERYDELMGTWMVVINQHEQTRLKIVALRGNESAQQVQMF